MPNDIYFLLGEGDIKHLNNTFQDDQNYIMIFRQVGIHSANLQVALEVSDDAHKYSRIPRVGHQFAFESSNWC